MSRSSQTSAMRKGWCPGALRPMQTGDGLLVRVKFSANRIACLTARELASLSATHGNGILDLSQRANLQLRGVTERSLPELIRALSELGLLDDDVAGESVRNILVSPLAGIDPNAADVSEIVTTLEAALTTSPHLHSLPGKFSFTIDAGGQFPLGATTSDITLRAGADKKFWALMIAGRDDPVTYVKTEQAAAAAIKLAEFYLTRQSDTVRRMRDVESEVTLQEPSPDLRQRDAEASSEGTRTVAIGNIPLTPSLYVAAVGLPFGRITSDQLSELSNAANGVGSQALHFTPWRSVFVPCKTTSDCDRLLSVAETSGLIIKHNDPRLVIDACPGQPGCSSGEVHAMDDAEKLANQLDLSGTPIAPGLIHVSGCAKGCARRLASPITLVGNDGRYDFILNGTTEARPSKTGIASTDLAATVQNTLRDLTHNDTQGAAKSG